MSPSFYVTDQWLDDIKQFFYSEYLNIISLTIIPFYSLTSRIKNPQRFRV
jgi:hypothetical protein